MTDEAGSSLFQFLANVAEVIDLTVVDDPVAALQIVHRLVAERREVENRQSPAAQANLNFMTRVLNDDRARVIRSTVGERLCGTLQNIRWNSRVMGHDTEDSAHFECRELTYRSYQR